MRGIDVSRWQGAIDWNKVKASGVEFAYIKLGGADDGIYFDSMAFANAIQCRRAGIPYGFYWYFASVHSVDAQLTKILQGLAQDGQYSLPVAVDIESKRFSASPHSAEVDSGLNLCDALKESGHEPIVYTGPYFWNTAWAYSVSRTTRGKVPYRLWIANYGVSSPSIPMGWTEYTVWQYSESGSVAGISGNVDLNVSDNIIVTGGDMTRGDPREQYQRVFNVAPEGATKEQWQEILNSAYPNKQTVGGSYDDAGVGNLDSRTAVLWGITADKRQTFLDFFSRFYPGVIVQFQNFSGSVIIPPPPNPVIGRTRFGVNVVTGNGDYARRALAAKCNALSIINNFQLASDLANDTSITVMARRYVNSMPPPDPDVVFEGAASPHVVYLTPLNECDVICYGTVEEIARRAAFDREMWAKMKARGRKYAGGGFSMGTPDYTKPEICDAMRTHYAPLYNSGMAINYHLYSPTMNHTPDIWYELRWRFLFEKCGFNPDPSLAGIYSDETGVDEGGVGGFPAHGASASQIGEWSRRFLDASQGNGYGNLLRAAVIFQSGNTTDWNGYNVDYAINEIGAAAQAPVTRQLERMRLPSYGATPEEIAWIKKVMSEYESR